METLELKTGWRLHESPLDWTADCLGRVLALPDGWMDCALPCDVHMPLIAAGRIGDPVVAENCYAGEWTTDRAWWFVRAFDGTDLNWDADVFELTLTGLDAHSDVFLNGCRIGGHDSAFYPFVRDVKEFTLPGENILAVRVTTGLEQVSQLDLAEINHAVCTEAGNNRPQRGDKRRAFVRKPAYCAGWDWAPKVITCGITGGASLRCLKAAVVRGVSVSTVSAGQDGELAVTVESELLDLIATADADLSVTVSYGGDVCARAQVKDLLMTSGVNFTDLGLTVPGARLWWPHGYGEQPLYDVDVAITCRGVTDRWPTFRCGIRTVALDTARTGPDTRRFALVVNGVPVFCKGGDWIPADSIYARVTDEKYEALIAEAARANFNMLRIWGGGLYETEAFYRACDEKGILIWHDFMFGCSAHPDHLPAFRALVAAEMDYQVKRLGSHPCLALWCGNNENHWIYNALDNPFWGIDIRHDKQFGLFTGNDQAVRAIRAHSPHIPYWNSSPYGGPRPNDPGVGDVHFWGDMMMNPDMNRRIDPSGYDKLRARFVTEYGYPGPVPLQSMAEYFGGAEPDPDSALWQHHTNTFEKDTVAAGIERHYLDGANTLPLSDYILYGGLVQMTMLGYSLESFRSQPACAGALFWMYNDTWGEVGWTIVDYYLRRKIAFYGVARALSPVRLILRRDGDDAVLTGCNDTAQNLSIPARVGYLSLDGAVDETAPVTLRLPPASRGVIWRGPLPQRDYTRGFFAALPQQGPAEDAVLRIHDLRRLRLPDAAVTVVASRPGEGGLEVTVRADGYAHAVHPEGTWDASDLYFDLLPGRSKTVVLYNCRETPAFTAVVPRYKVFPMT